MAEGGKIQTLIPVPISVMNDQNNRLVENADGNISLKSGPPIGTTVIAGRIAAVEDREGYWAIVFDDGSECFLVRYYNTDKAVQPQVNEFWHAYGNLRKNKSGKGFNLAAFCLHKMTDQSQAQCSVKMLEAISAVKCFKAGSGGSSRAADPTPGNFAPQRAVNTGHSAAITGKTPQHNQVLDVVLKVETEEGAKVMEDFEHLRIPEATIREILVSLADEGHIYSTVDDDHFKST